MSTQYFAIMFYPDHQGDLALNQLLTTGSASPQKVIGVMKDGFTNSFDPSDNISKEFSVSSREERWNLAWEISRRILFEHYEKLFMLSGKVGLAEYRKFLKYRQSCKANESFFSPLEPYFSHEGYPLFLLGDPRENSMIMFLKT